MVSETQRAFPIQHHAGERLEIPWWLAEKAYETYSRWFGKEQTLERLAERGGFGLLELQYLLDGTTKNYKQWLRGPSTAAGREVVS